MKKVLVLSSQFLIDLYKYQNIFKEREIEVISMSRKPKITYEELYNVVDQYDGIVVGGTDNFDEKMIKKASVRVKVLAKWGVGVNNIDMEASRKYGIKVGYSPGYLAEPVANMVIAYIIMLSRQLHTQNNEMHKGRWTKKVGLSPRGRTLGVIGLGAIGKKVIEKATLLGMKFLINDIKKIDNEFLNRFDSEFVNINELFKRSDFVSLCCSQNEENYHLLNESTFALMKDGVFIINTARGTLIDENALVQALESGKVSGAALDVFEKEPINPDNPLIKFDNLILSPHNGNSEDVAILNVTKNTVDILLRNL